MADLLQETGERVEALLKHFGAFPPSTHAREDAEELVQRVSALYGEGLRRLLQALKNELGERAHEVLEPACSDTIVTALLVTHALHPVPLEERVRRAVESVLPYMKSHGGGVEILSIDEDAVDVKLQGSCDGCTASQATLKDALERAIFAAAPEVLQVRAAEPTQPEHAAPPSIGVLPVVLR